MHLALSLAVILNATDGQELQAMQRTHEHICGKTCMLDDEVVLLMTTNAL